MDVIGAPVKAISQFFVLFDFQFASYEALTDVDVVRIRRLVILGVENLLVGFGPRDLLVRLFGCLG